MSVPTGLITAIAVMVAYGLARAQEVRPDESRTAATVVAMVIGLVVLFLVAQPLVPWKVALIASMGGLFALAMVIPKTAVLRPSSLDDAGRGTRHRCGGRRRRRRHVEVARHRLEAAARQPQVSPG